MDAPWRGDPGPSPFKARRSPIISIPGCDKRSSVLLDYLHIFHLGVGMDTAASSIMLYAHLKHYGAARKMDDRLEVAFEHFDTWCHEQGRTSSLDEFSKDKFKIKTGKILAS